MLTASPGVGFDRQAVNFKAIPVHMPAAGAALLVRCVMARDFAQRW